MKTAIQDEGDLGGKDEEIHERLKSRNIVRRLRGTDQETEGIKKYKIARVLGGKSE